MNKIVLFIIFLLIPAIFNSCTQTTSNPEERIKERVHALMTAKVNNDWKSVYTFFDKNYKSKITKTRFNAARKIQFLEYHIKNIQMDPSNKKAQVLVMYNMMVNGVTVEKIKDQQSWIIESSDWFLAAKPITGLTG